MIGSLTAVLTCRAAFTFFLFCVFKGQNKKAILACFLCVMGRAILNIMMNSNQHTSAYGYNPRMQQEYSPKPRIDEDTLRSESLQIERKTFILALKENIRGRL